MKGSTQIIHLLIMYFHLLLTSPFLLSSIFLRPSLKKKKAPLSETDFLTFNFNCVCCESAQRNPNTIPTEQHNVPTYIIFTILQ